MIDTEVKSILIYLGESIISRPSLNQFLYQHLVLHRLSEPATLQLRRCLPTIGMGVAYGTTNSGVGVASKGAMRPELVMKSIVPVVMDGVLGIYRLIISVIISTGINPKAKSYYLFDGYAHLSSRLACALDSLFAGMAIGIVGDIDVSEALATTDTQTAAADDAQVLKIHGDCLLLFWVIFS